MPRPRLHPFEAAVLATARERRLFDAGSRVLAAMSGGPDSTALVAALAALRDASLLGEVTACHVDHRLRPESAADAEVCARSCAALGVSLERVAVTVGARAGVQAGARRARYSALRDAAARVGADLIATGHTRGDQAETVILRLLRGAGARGLGGIPPRRGRIVRPLLDRSRGEALSYLACRGLSWCDDPSNASPVYLRNRVRAEIIPALERLAPGVEVRLARAARLLRDDDRVLEAKAARLVPRGATSVDREALAAAPLPVRRRAVRRMWLAASGRRAGLAAEHVEAVLGIAARDRPARVALPGGLTATSAYGAVEVAVARPPPAPVRPRQITAPGRCLVPERQLAVEIAVGPGAPPAFPLELRGRRPGDRFRPERGRGEKKLKAWLIDRKVPRAWRDALIVIADAHGRILALPELGVRGAAAGALDVRLAPAEGACERAWGLQPPAAPVIRKPRVRRRSARPTDPE